MIHLDKYGPSEEFRLGIVSGESDAGRKMVVIAGEMPAGPKQRSLPMAKTTAIKKMAA